MAEEDLEDDLEEDVEEDDLDDEEGERWFVLRRQKEASDHCWCCASPPDWWWSSGVFYRTFDPLLGDPEKTVSGANPLPMESLYFLISMRWS